MTRNPSLALDHSELRSRPKTLFGSPPASELELKYEQLEGGAGREINFRPPRYPSSELGPVGAVVDVAQGGEVHQCELYDISQNGVAFEWVLPRLLVGETIPCLTVRFDRHEAYRGEARVGSVRDVEGKQIVGASFLDTLMNIEDVLQLRDVKAWTRAGQGPALRERPWRVAGHERFKSLVAELRLFLLDAEEQLGELETSLPWHVAHGDQDSPARAALIERVRVEVVAEIVSASNAIDGALRGASPAERQALKEYSLRHLHGFLMQSPWMRRAREKPLGYPGDFEIMNSVYGHHFNGHTLFAKAVNMGFVWTAGAAAVRERKNVIKEQLLERLNANTPEGTPLRILSIAAGPAQETYELLQECETLPRPLEVVLFDQDKRALAFSYGRLKRVVGSKWPHQVKIIYLHDSIKRLLRDPTIFSGFGTFDVIFSCGLFDYLQRRTASSLAATLYGNLAPGGTVFIGNMTPANPSRWFMELHLDWFLIYREQAEILDFARTGAPDARLSILEERTGINPFVTLTRD
jgi:extracellular factor (EF) 3-hydroxypalmitic acid methyl ester biosynthesis protein